MSRRSEVADLGGLVELAAHTVAHIVPDHGEAVGLYISLDRVADVGHPAALTGHLDALPEALLGHSDELLRLGADRAAGIGSGAVPVEPADEGAHVHADDVALLELSGAGNAVDHLVIDGDAGRTGVAAVTQEGGLRAVALDEPAHRRVDLVGGDPGGHHGAGQSPGLGGDPPGPAHGLDLTGGLNGNHFNALQDCSASMIAWVVASMVGRFSTRVSRPLA